MDEVANMKAIGFTVVPIKTLKGNEKMQYVHLKKLDARLGKADKSRPPNRTVFVGNIPPWATENDLQLALKRCGEIERVVLQPAQSTESEEEKKRRVAYIIFSKSEAADRAVQLPSTSPLLIIPEGCPTGLARYWAMHLESRKFDMGQIEKDIRQRIAEYDRKEKEEEEAAKNPEPDDEGWVTVTRVGKNKGAPRTEAEDNRLKTKETGKRKRKEKPNFYSFQNRAMKRQRIEELRNKFQQDKSAIEKMKKERKFRPF